MNLRKWLYSSFFTLTATVMLTHSAHAGQDAYGSNAVMPTIYSKNIWYYTEYPVVGNPPANKTLTLVYYNWSYPAPRPAGLTVYLCNSAVTLCADVTTVQSGSVNFTGQGVPATTPLRIYAGVSGSGTMSPLYGGTTNIVVNYQSNP